MVQLHEAFPDAVVGLSDHTLSIYPCLGSVALGASVLERHFTDRKDRCGPDIEVSMDPSELSDLIVGARAIHESLRGSKAILDEEMPTIRFAYACVVTTKLIAKGEKLTADNIWVKRPGTGNIKAKDYVSLLGRQTRKELPAHVQLDWDDLV
jgi:N-acetylneuraminate synthase